MGDDLLSVLGAVGDWISFGAGTALLVMSFLVLVAYRPSRHRTTPERTLAAAIVLGFIAAAGNTLYWQVLGQPLVVYGWITVDTLRFIGDYLDLVFKGGAALAGYLHLRALWFCLPDAERRVWLVVEMPFYPRRLLYLRKRGALPVDEGEAQ